MLAEYGRAANPLLRIPHLAGVLVLPYASLVCALSVVDLWTKQTITYNAEVKGRAVDLCRSERACCLMLNNHM